jgi:hypothetical protein
MYQLLAPLQNEPVADNIRVESNQRRGLSVGHNPGKLPIPDVMIYFCVEQIVVSDKTNVVVAWRPRRDNCGRIFVEFFRCIISASIEWEATYV